MRQAKRCEYSKDEIVILYGDAWPYLFSWETAGWTPSKNQVMSERIQRASLIVEGFAFQPVACRVARLLLEQAQDQDISLRSLTLEEMAARIGSTREMVCRSIQRFAGAGLIEVTRTEFYITDRKRLEKLAEQGKG